MVTWHVWGSGGVRTPVMGTWVKAVICNCLFWVTVFDKKARSFFGSISCLFARRCVQISCSLRLVGFLTETRAVIQPPPYSPGVNHRRGVKENARGTKKQDTSFSFLGGTEQRLRIS